MNCGRAVNLALGPVTYIHLNSGSHGSTVSRPGFKFQVIRNSAIADKPRDAFRGKSRSPNMLPFHMLDIVSYCAIVTLSLRRTVFTIFDFKNVVTLK